MFTEFSEDNLLVVHFARGFSPGQVKSVVLSDDALIIDVPYPRPCQFSDVQLMDVVVTANSKCER